jgi:hypothetical protein
MELKQIRGSKSLKLLFLLLSSLLIASVSASIYYTMYMNATNIGVATGNKVFFRPGSDWTGTSTMGPGNQTVTLDGLKGKNGTATVIGDPVRIYNNDTSNHSINLQLASWSGAGQTQLNYINVTMWNAYPTGGTQQGQTIYLPSNSTGSVTQTLSQTIGTGLTWRVEWVIYWKTTATTQTVNVNLQLIVS